MTGRNRGKKGMKEEMKETRKARMEGKKNVMEGRNGRKE